MDESRTAKRGEKRQLGTKAIHALEILYNTIQEQEQEQ